VKKRRDKHKQTKHKNTI